jgi:two-component system, OmpR family, KDP operon response regulator KdpE
MPAPGTPAPTAPAPCVLVVEDEPAMTRLLRSVLTAAGYRVFEVGTAKEALLQAAGRSPDLVLLDLGLPDGDGVDVVRRLREWMRAPIVVVSARDREQGKIEALDAGADDYLTKPFGTGELLARTRAALRHAARPPGGAPPVFQVGDLRVDLEKRQVSVADAPVHVTRTEWKLLAVLVRHAGKVVLQRQLLREVWSPAEENQPHYLRVYVASLRRKLEREPAKPRYLLTETGVGYRLRDE